MSVDQMLGKIHTIYPRWMPSVRAVDKEAQIKALYFRLLNSGKFGETQVKGQTKLFKNPRKEKFGQLSLFDDTSIGVISQTY